MCTSPRLVREAFRDLMISPTRFFSPESEGGYSKATLAWVLGLGLLISLVLQAAGQVIELRIDWATVVGVMPAQLGESVLMAFPPLLVVFGFLWLTSRVVKATLNWLQALILCLFYILPALILLNLIKLPVLLIVPDEEARMAVMAGVILVAILWSLTVMILGVQAYTKTSWVRALGAVSPVAVIMFTMGGAFVAETLLRLTGVIPDLP